MKITSIWKDFKKWLAGPSQEPLPKQIIGLLGLLACACFIIYLFKWSLFIYIGLYFASMMVLGYLIHIRGLWIIRKANAVDPSFYIGKKYSRCMERSISVIGVAEEEFDDEGNRLYSCQVDPGDYYESSETNEIIIPADQLYQNIIKRKNWNELK